MRNRQRGVVLAAAAAPEDGLRQGLRALAYELTVSEARERDRIARDLHDEIGQFLAAARFKLTELRQCLPAEQPALFDELGGLLAQASRATRSATFDLSSPALRLGLEEALRGLAHRLTRKDGPIFRVEGEMPPHPGSEAVQSVLYRVVRELALNVQRHAHARQAWIRLHSDGLRLSVSVSDDGIGIAPDWSQRGVSRDGGFGLVSAQAQMQALGGTLALESGAGSGTLATLTLPLEPLEARARIHPPGSA